jgi:uncharacterized protein YukE
MADELQYDFGKMEMTNSAIQQRLGEFRNYLEEFKKTYLQLAQTWGGRAAEGAGQVAQDLDKFGNGVADTVGVFQQRMVAHRDESMAMEAQNAGLFG